MPQSIVHPEKSRSLKSKAALASSKDTLSTCLTEAGSGVAAGAAGLFYK